MESCFRQDRFAGQQRFGNVLGDFHRPRMKTVGAIAKGYDQAGIGNAFMNAQIPSGRRDPGGR